MSYTLVPSELIVDGAITSAKLDTNIAISGTLGVTGEVTLATHLVMGDNDKIKIGTGGDLEIYHDGSNSYIANSTGNIYIADTNGAVHIQAKLNEESIVATADGAVTLYHDNSAKLATASGGVTVTGTLTPSGVLTANAGVVVDNITIDGSTISDSGNLTIDAGGDIILDVDGADVFFKDNGTTFGQIRNASNNLRIQSSIQDADIVFRGDDGGSTITALTLDMSAAGAATFNAGVTATTGTFSGAVSASSVDASAGFLNGSNGGIRIHSGGTKFFNITAANAARDNHMDIGASDARFKGLYLGNKIFIGGLIVASNDAGRIGLNRNPDDGTHISSDSVQRFQINGPSSSGDYLDFQNYDTSGNYVGGFRIEDGAIRAEPMPVSTPSYSLITILIQV